MGTTNTQINLTNEIARWKGERESKQAAIDSIEAGLTMLETLRARVAVLDGLVAAADTVLAENNPDWSSEAVAPRKKTNRHSPIPYGMLGRTGLEVMRDAPERGMLARDVARGILERFDLDATDRGLLDQISNSVGIYLKKHEGDLVRSDGERLYKRWSLIRKTQ